MPASASTTRCRVASAAPTRPSLPRRAKRDPPASAAPSTSSSLRPPPRKRSARSSTRPPTPKKRRPDSAPPAAPLLPEEHPADAAHPTAAPTSPARMPWRTGGGRARESAAITNPLDDDYLLDEILTRLPDAACLLQQLVLVSRSWCRVVVSGEGFLARFRARHPSSPLVGVFVDIKAEDHPRFYASPKPHIACAVRGTDKLLTRIQDESDLRWFVRDCRNGRLLLAEPQGSLIVYDPLSQRPFVYIGAARTQLDRRWKCLGHCLLELHGPAGNHLQANDSFRVISLQRQSGSRLNVRAVEYNSGTLEWHEVYPHTGWTQVQSTKLQMKPTYAAGHIFWQADATKLLVLDTSTMKFSEHAVPEEMGSTSWAIGELEDGKGCLVCIRSIGEEKRLRLEVWTLEKEKEGGDKQATFCCKREKDAWVGKMLRGEPGVNKVRKVVNGLAVIGNTSASYVIDLQSMTRVTEFPSVGDAYPYQMSWPPALAAATGVACRHLAAAAAAAAEEGNYTMAKKAPLLVDRNLVCRSRRWLR